jgi:hypothetical protein
VDVNATVDCADAAPRRRNWTPLILGTLAIIVVGHIFPLLGLPRPGLIENRVLAPMPAMPTTLHDLAALPKQLDDFVSDNFPTRTYMIGGLNYIRYRLGYSGTNKIIVGRDGWLFFDDTNHLGMAAGKHRLDAASQGYWMQGLKERVDYLNRRGIKFYMTIGPVKEDIYPEHRPRWMPKKRVDTEVDDLFRLAHQAGYSQLVDPRAAILAQKNQQMLYGPYDTHWTALGAYIGYRELMRRISEDFPGMEPLPMSAFEVPPFNPSLVPRDLSLMLGIAELVPHNRETLITFPIHDPAKTEFLSSRHDWTAPQVLHTDSPSGKTVVLLRDSFTSEMLPMLKKHFSTIVMAHFQDGIFRTDLIERYHPDMVILIVIESGMRGTMDVRPDL